jgi:hypothetical protein
MIARNVRQSRAGPDAPFALRVDPMFTLLLLIDYRRARTDLV